MSTGTDLSWQTHTQLPTPRGGTGNAAVDGKIYVIGGALNPYHYLPNVDRYDPAADQWQSCPPLPQPRNNTVCAVIGKVIYVIAGLDEPQDQSVKGSVPSARLQAYDTTTDQWTDKTDLPFPRVKPAVAVFDGKIYIFGGRHEAQNTTQIAAYDPQTDSWSVIGDLPIAVRHPAGCACDGKIYITGGWECPAEPGDAATIHDELIRFDPVTQKCEVIGRLPAPRCGHSLVAVDGKLYALGGLTTGKQFITAVDIYDTTTGQWETGPALGHQRSTFAAVVIDKSIHLPGGWEQLAKLPQTACERLNVAD